MEEAEKKSKKLNKKQIDWLKLYGYTLTTVSEHEEEARQIKEYIHDNFIYEYNFYVNLDVKRKAEKIYKEQYGNDLKCYRGKFNKIKRKLIEEMNI
ncbi:MAG: hypothetical protein LBN09_05690 [Clostridioides sp.]|jgi:hypothetical protein|nr:hypothetical protein [Clostridioides sp.]